MSAAATAIRSAQKSITGNPKLASREVQLRVLKRLGMLVDGRTIHGMKTHYSKR